MFGCTPPRETTLIVHTDPRTTQALAKLAGNSGHQTACAATLAEAVHRLSKDQPNRILLHLKLPDGSGADLLRRVRQLEMPVRVGVLVDALDDLPPEVESLAPDLIAQPPIDIHCLIDWLSDPLDDAKFQRSASF